MKRVLLILFLFQISSFSFKAQISRNIDSLLAAEGGMAEGPEKVRLLRDIGFNYTVKASDKALLYFNRALVLGERMGEYEYTGSTCSQLAILHNNLGNIELSDFYLNKTNEKAKKSNLIIVWKAYFQAATLINKKRKRFKEALIYAQKYVEISKGGKRDESLAGGYLNLANTEFELKKLNKAIKNFYSALEIFDEVGNERGQAYVYNNLGIVYRDLKQYNEAIKNAKYALALKEKIKDEKGVASSYGLMGEGYLGLDKYKEANLYLDKSIAINEKLQLDFELVNNYWLKARIYSKTKDSLNSLKYYDFAIEKAKKLDAPVLLNDIENEKIDFISKNSSTKSISTERTFASQSAFLMARKVNDSAAMLTNLKSLAVHFHDNKDFEKAFDYQTQYYELYDKLYGGEVLKQLKEVETKYELNKKENAISLLQKDKQINVGKMRQQQVALIAAAGLVLLIILIAYLIFTRNRALQDNKRKLALNKMRNGIARDLHDDIGSTLSSIQIISDLIQRNEVQNPKIKEAAGHISELSDKVASGIRDIVWATNPDNDRLEAIIAQMRKYATELLKASEIAFTVTENLKNNDLVINPNVRKNILMCFKEAINNARKYSETSNIDIYITQGRKYLKIVIRDFGKGFDRGTIIPGNGLINMEKRIDEINGKLLIRTENGRGTTVRFLIPISLKEGID